MAGKIIKGVSWMLIAATIASVSAPYVVYGAETDTVTDTDVSEQRFVFQKSNFKEEIQVSDGKFDVVVRTEGVPEEAEEQILEVRTVITTGGDDSQSVTYVAGSSDLNTYVTEVSLTDINDRVSDVLSVNTVIYISENTQSIQKNIPEKSYQIDTEPMESEQLPEGGYSVELDSMEVQISQISGANGNESASDIVPEPIQTPVPTPESSSENGQEEFSETTSTSEDDQKLDSEGIAEETSGVNQLVADNTAVISGVDVEKLNSETGEFTIRIRGASATAEIQRVQVPIWCHENQDDLIWYDAVIDGDDYVVRGTLQNHGYHLGIYQVNVYITDQNNTRFGVGATTFQAELKYDSFQVQAMDNSESEYRAELTGLLEYGAVSEVLIAVWSENGGQDDLLWYSAKKGENYSQRIDVKNHKGTGIYQVHCYARLKDGTMIFLQACQFEASAPKIQKVAACLTDNSSGEFEIVIEGASSGTGINKIQVPVWCSSDQNDLVWYTAEKEGSTYVVRTDIANHKYHLGSYKINVYITDDNGNMYGVGATELNLPATYKELNATPIGETQKQYGISLSGLECYGAPVEIWYAVWSENNGQDDLLWFKTDVENQVYQKTINIADFKSVGTYQVHAYLKNSDGTMLFLGKTAFSIAAPSCDEVISSADKDTGDFQIVVQNAKATGGITYVQIPVWSASDQSDLVWYTAEYNNGNYIVNSNISRHKNNMGIYQYGIYVTDGNGIRTGVASGILDLSLEAGNLSAVESISDGLYYRTELNGAHFCGQDEKVLFAVWSEQGGQDDLVWYEAVQEGETYMVTIPIANHMTTETYFINAYVRLKDGTMRGLTSAEFQVQSIPKEKIVISNVDGQAGTFDVAVYLVRQESQIAEVLVPVWNAADQSDMVWYTAQKEEDGIYHVQVNVQNHQLHFGKYQVNAYVRDGSGQLIGVTSADVNLNADNYVVQEQLSDAVYTITVYGANANGKTATEVRFPTWSAAGNQDDLIWYNGNNDGNGNFSVTIYRRNHNRDGEYITHIYVYAGSETEGLNTKVYYELSSPTEFDTYAKEVMHNIIYAVETGGQIYGNARYNDFTQAYTNSSRETAITIGAGAWFATEAKNLLNQIRQEDPATFAALDTAGIGYDLDHADWSTYGGDGNGNPTILKGSAKAVCIQNIISSQAGIAVQDRLVDEQMERYVNEAEALGVTDLKARMFCANIRHLGGYGAMEWVIEVCIEDGKSLTMENLWTSMRDHTPNKGGNGVGADKYKTRHEKVMGWLNQHIG